MENTLYNGILINPYGETKADKLVMVKATWEEVKKLVSPNNTVNFYNGLVNGVRCMFICDDVFGSKDKDYVMYSVTNASQDMKLGGAVFICKYSSEGDLASLSEEEVEDIYYGVRSYTYNGIEYPIVEFK